MTRGTTGCLAVPLPLGYLLSMHAQNQSSTRKMTLAFAAGAAILGSLAVIAILAFAYNSAPDPWGAFEWSFAVVTLLVFAALCAGVGAVVAWLLRLIFTDR